MERKQILLLALFMAFWGVPFLLKMLSTKKKSPKRKGLTLRVLEFITAIKEANERGQGHLDSQQMGGTTPFEATQPAPFIVERENLEFVAPTTPMRAASEFRERSSKPPVVRERCRQTTAQASCPRNAASKIVDRNFSKQKMRDAIAWREILGPPVGLRDHQ